MVIFFIVACLVCALSGLLFIWTLDAGFGDWEQAPLTEEEELEEMWRAPAFEKDK